MNVLFILFSIVLLFALLYTGRRLRLVGQELDNVKNYSSLVYADLSEEIEESTRWQNKYFEKHREIAQYVKESQSAQLYWQKIARRKYNKRNNH